MKGRRKGNLLSPPCIEAAAFLPENRLDSVFGLPAGQRQSFSPEEAVLQADSTKNSD
ncbi:hypothetical protein [Bacteroides zoogleoformans]|uniref:hypothetical protein n=1 Tax=Bacteroides zoogleoformans TaxID=28119 RepID=UPI00248E0CC1|nr:hypothetical protein [Bacteroides zoogleoformans]